MSPIRVGWRFTRLFKMFIGRFNKPLNHVHDPIHWAIQSLWIASIRFTMNCLVNGCSRGCALGHAKVFGNMPFELNCLVNAWIAYWLGDSRGYARGNSRAPCNSWGCATVKAIHIVAECAWAACWIAFGPLFTVLIKGCEQPVVLPSSLTHAIFVRNLISDS